MALLSIDIKGTYKGEYRSLEDLEFIGRDGIAFHFRRRQADCKAGQGKFHERWYAVTLWEKNDTTDFSASLMDGARFVGADKLYGNRDNASIISELSVWTGTRNSKEKTFDFVRDGDGFALAGIR